MLSRSFIPKPLRTEKFVGANEQIEKEQKEQKEQDRRKEGRVK